MSMSVTGTRHWKWRLAGMFIGSCIVLVVFSGRSYFNFIESAPLTSYEEASSNLNANAGNVSSALENSNTHVEAVPIEPSITTVVQEEEQQSSHSTRQQSAIDEPAEPIAVGIQVEEPQEDLDSSSEVDPTDSSADSDNLGSSETTRNWSKVWRAFRSERTARGFAEYISDSTGLTLRVSGLADKGEYYVEVSHSTKAQHQAAIERIVQATGYRPLESELQIDEKNKE